MNHNSVQEQTLDSRGTVRVNYPRDNAEIIERLVNINEITYIDRASTPGLVGIPQPRDDDKVRRYKTLPKDADPDESPFFWLIELHRPERNSEAVGIRLVGDVILGRAGGSYKPDIDLTSFGARHRGVSRQHALIRPTRNQLFLIDLNSTNGTQVNALPLGQSSARPLLDRDLITLGNLSFTIRVVGHPALRRAG